MILAPALFDKVVQRTMDGHHLEQIVRLLSKQGEIDDKFASLLVEQLLSICAIESGSVFFEFDRLIRSIFKHLIQTHPCELWAKVSRLLVHNNTHDLFYLDRLIDDDRDDRLAAGILFGLPKAIYLDWVRADQAARASIVAKWLPITSSESAGKLVWHADLESYVNEFGREPKVLDQLSRRMRPGGWCGSLVPHLEPMLRLLASWSKHPLAEVRTWANQQTQSIQREITDAWKRDEESGVRM